MAKKSVGCIHCVGGVAVFVKTKIEGGFPHIDGYKKRKINIYKCGTCRKNLWRYANKCDNVSCETSKKGD